MVHWNTGFLQANGLQIHYSRTGGNKPSLLLVHGFSDDGLCWTPVAAELADDYDVIMVDARGHGQSEGPEQGYALTEMAADLAGVIQGLGLEKPAVLGHSMGGAATLVMAGLYPDLPGAILIEDSGPLNLTTGSRPDGEERKRAMRNRLIELKRKTREELLASVRTQAPNWSEAEYGPWADAKLRFSIHAFERLGTSVPGWENVLRKISCPTLLITADTARGALVSPEDAATMQGLIPQLEIAHVSDAGHNVRREQFGPYMEAVRSFLMINHA